MRCSRDRPWGIHDKVRNDGDCPRCGWTAPGPAGDARSGARMAARLTSELAGARTGPDHGRARAA